jgi:hypothetical protein
MIYELRVYTALPGRMPDLLARFKDHTVSIWQKHGIIPVGFWTTLIGHSTRELTYILAWNSLADREIKWAAFQSDHRYCGLIATQSVTLQRYLPGRVP